MTVKIRRDKLRLSFAVPVSLVLFGLGKAAEKGDKKYGVSCKLSKQTKREIKYKLKQAKKDFGRMTIVDVQATDGTKVKITL